MNKKQTFTGRNSGRWLSLCLIMVFLTGLMLVRSESSAAVCTELADVPLELKSRAAPGLISLVVDNSRTMYYTIMTSQGNGTYNVNGTDYAILFPDHTFSANFLPPEYRNHWKTQWSGFNTMYYNPDVNYKPWPRWHQLTDGSGNFIADNPPADGNADFANSRYHPLSDDETINLGETFYAYGGGSLGAAIYVDNSDAAFQTDTGAWNNSSTGLITWEDPNGTRTSSYTGDHPAKASWTVSGLDWKTSYDVWVYIPHYATSQFPDQKDAKYTVTGAKTESVTRFQPDYPGWTLLATPIKPDKTTGEIIIDIESVGAVAGNFIDADAVCVAPVASFDPTVAPPAGSINIIYGHYFVQNANGTYLVNMDGTLDYYQFNDANGDDVVDFGELIKLTDAEAAAAGIVTGRSYDAERQNFANWHQFYRKRMYTGVAAVAQFIQDLSGVFFRLYGFPSAGFKDQMRALDIGLPGIADETDIVLANFYELKPPQANPNETVLAALHDVGGLIKDGNSLGAGKNTDFGVDVDGEYYSAPDTYPYFTEKHGGQCQQAFAIVMTGGYWVVKNNSEELADVAATYYDTDLRANLANLVPEAPNNLDSATYQHLVTYGLSFGVKGTLDPNSYPQCAYGGPCPTWPAITSADSEGPKTIDDLWHATVNGHGLFINAANPEELVAALKAIRSDIERRLGSAAAVSTNSVQRQTGTHLYQGRYDSNFWSGDLLAFPIDVTDGSVLAQLWSAKDVMDDDSITDWTQRNIYTFGSAGGISFDYASLTAAQKTLLDPADPARAALLVDYLKGDRTLEQNQGGPFRTRASRLGDIVHSEPVYNDNAIYVGANDGMLHAFAADDGLFPGIVGGQELFAYIPNMVFGHLAKIAEPSYDHLYYVNNTPYAKYIGSTTLLVGGLGKGGKGYYCLDISTPATFGTSNVKWEYSAVVEGDDDLGYSFSRPFIVNTKAAGWVVIFGNGYNSVNGEAVLYILDADTSDPTGDVIKKIPTGVTGCNGIVAPPAIIDPNVDGYADYVYVGDLLGNMWKFDISGSSINDWEVAYASNSGATPQPLFTAKNAVGDAQPITAMADIMRHCSLGRDGYIVIFGTGQYVNEADFDTINVQTIYGIWDTQAAWEYMVANSLTAVDPKETFLGEFKTDRTLSNTTRWSGISLLEQSGYFYSYNSQLYFIMSDNPIDYWDYSDPTNFGGQHVGWYFDLPGSAERVIRDPVIRSGIALFMGSTPVQTPCSSGGSTTIYMVDACSGGAPEKPQFDTSDDDKVTTDDVIIINGDEVNPSGIFVDEMLYKPVDIKDRLYISDDSADILEVPVPPALGGMLYWRETDIRR